MESMIICVTLSFKERIELDFFIIIEIKIYLLKQRKIPKRFFLFAFAMTSFLIIPL